VKLKDDYSVKEVARIFAVDESRLRYWAQTGFVNPSVRRRGRRYYTFADLIAVKTAVELLAAGLPMQRVRKNLTALRQQLPEAEMTNLAVSCDGDTIVATDNGVVFEPETGQLVLMFTADSLATQIDDVLKLPVAAAQPEPPAPMPVADTRPPTAYRYFLAGCDAEETSDDRAAEHCYRQALQLEPFFAAAHTNLGNLLYRRGDLAGARAHYEQSLDCEPDQAEARYNLGNLLEDMGETESAIAELRRVCNSHPQFADAHYNLALILARVGGLAQARSHLEIYLEIDADSEWAQRLREFLLALV